MAGPKKAREAGSAQLTAIFIVGVASLIAAVVIAIMIPEPTKFQLRVFQLVLAAAAGGIGALLPGAIGVNVGVAKAAGAVGLFVFVYWVDPPSLHYGKDGESFDTLIKEAESALATPGHYRQAEQKFREAVKTNPQSHLPHNGLGRTYYREGQFELSVQSFQTAFELSGRRDPNQLYHKAVSELALRRYDDAATDFELASRLGGNVKESELAKLIVYDLGATRFAQWLTSGFDPSSPHYDQAVRDFSLFIESGGYPKQWAHYYRACLKAYNAVNKGPADQQATNLRSSAADDLSAAVREIRDFRGSSRPYHVKLIKTMLETPASYKQQVGDPAGCPPLPKIWQEDRGSISDLLKGIEG